MSTGAARCLAKQNEYDFNGESLSDNVIFDKANRAYFIGRKNNSIYGSSGTEKTRLIRIESDGTLSAIVDQSGYIASSMTRGKGGSIFFGWLVGVDVHLGMLEGVGITPCGNPVWVMTG